MPAVHSQVQYLTEKLYTAAHTRVYSILSALELISLSILHPNKTQKRIIFPEHTYTVLERQRNI